jgi:hypothetical protein
MLSTSDFTLLERLGPEPVAAAVREWRTAAAHLDDLAAAVAAAQGERARAEERWRDTVRLHVSTSAFLNDGRLADGYDAAAREVDRAEGRLRWARLELRTVEHAVVPVAQAHSLELLVAVARERQAGRVDRALEALYAKLPRLPLPPSPVRLPDDVAEAIPVALDVLAAVWWWPSSLDPYPPPRLSSPPSRSPLPLPPSPPSRFPDPGNGQRTAFVEWAWQRVADGPGTGFTVEGGVLRFVGTWPTSDAMGLVQLARDQLRMAGPPPEALLPRR